MVPNYPTNPYKVFGRGLTWNLYTLDDKIFVGKRFSQENLDWYNTWSILHQISAEVITRPVDIFIVGEYVHIVVEYFTNVPLDQNHDVFFEDILEITRQLLSSLKDIHLQGKVHNNINASNIYWVSDTNLMTIDYPELKLPPRYLQVVLLGLEKMGPGNPDRDRIDLTNTLLPYLKVDSTNPYEIKLWTILTTSTRLDKLLQDVEILYQNIIDDGINNYVAILLGRKWSSKNIESQLKQMDLILELMFEKSDLFEITLKALPLIKAVRGDFSRDSILDWINYPNKYTVSELYGFPVISRSQLEDIMTIKRVLGKGDDGTVYLVNIKGEDLALKRIHGREPASDYMRWMKEYLILEQLKDHPHPNVMKVYDAYFVYEDKWRIPIFYYTMQLVPGKPICCDINVCNQKITSEELLPLTIQVIEALKHIHTFGIIHRDLDGCNMMWNPITRHATIIDFGYACSLKYKGTLAGCEAGILAPYYPDPSLELKYKLSINKIIKGHMISFKDSQAEDIWIAGLQLYRWLEVAQKDKKSGQVSLLRYKPWNEVFDYTGEKSNQKRLAQIISSMMLPIDKRPTAHQLSDLLKEMAPITK